MKLYDYFRSTACYRVRIALNLKKIAYEKVNIHLVNHGGEQHSPEYREVNPQGLVPSLEINGQVISQSLAIIDYLEETVPNPALLPQDPWERSAVRSLALMVACDMHPLNNLRVLNRLKDQFQATETQVTEWYHHWLKAGFDAFEAKLKSLKRREPFCFGDSVSLADLCLIPQVYNAHRFHFPMGNYPLINEINAHCLTLEAFQKAVPEVQ
ncbi:maleylacetoacetate isomerase [Fluoribacter dumoffii]|uniref:Glutathione S-transferase n=1 Tax=Fluoribacter dumoffii TaxID=463 RepID=A0A377G7B7_9GAMM|nr:maleylacetoacetate isomerase [Fluoribacter dumoffii]KTC89430.1 glutathione S-transferase (maleylacetoacetate isomerase) [Fluoribacter dumoffii NY 23]MCW8386774.1 maleylacetoacetate isomerase [Fluoribacter dumoffii]MCW8417691.1 maleylacetoacetate isomerase [Fluoribacter dumoffii]MCW8454467.1 maleylacetoacetate isomerase [Fluoribacter dumoffii]MCW8461459.1 maleylacetoacetate isomerase [Fluoribacter dumoffii]